jgi:hypothetical protein
VKHAAHFVLRRGSLHSALRFERRLEAAGVEPYIFFRTHANHRIKIREYACRFFPFTNQNESKRAFFVRNCQEIFNPLVGPPELHQRLG